MAAPMRRIDPRLLEFCTEAQRQVLESCIKHGSLTAGALALGRNRGAGLEALRAAEKKAAIHGYSPQHDLTHVVAPGFVAKGHSTLYDGGGKPVLQWVKTTRDMQAQEQIIRDSIDALMACVPRAKPTKAPGDALSKLCNVYTLTDCHVGMHAWGKQTGADWDLSIAEQTLIAAFEQMIRGTPAARVGVVAQLGDFLHFDSLEALTPTNKHLLDADSRFSKVVAVAVRILRGVIDMALERHAEVIVLMAEGNHDPASSVWLRHMFQLLYEHEPRLTVIDAEIPYYVHKHGKTMLGWHHGHLKKKEALPILFASQYPEIWGETKHRYIHTGHMHHVDEKEHSGVYVVQHPTIAARDAYAARGGWVAGRHVNAITYHDEHGEVARMRVVPEML